MFLKSQQQPTEDGILQLREFLAEYQDIFSLTENERGGTDLVEF